MVMKLQKTEILRLNTKIDTKVVEAQEKLESKLNNLGVEIKPEYKAEPPLGNGTARFCNQNF